MIQKIRNSRISKIISSYLALQMIISVAQPSSLYALTSGPSQPEFNSFTPIGTSDMVNLSTGDFNYNIPIMDVGGYPLNLAYDSGVTMDQEASWVGLGWNLNVGQITRNVRGLPDDFNGDEMRYENNIKDNISVGTIGDVRFALFGSDFISLGVSLGVQFNNYNGISFNTSFGPSFDISDRITIGAQFGGTSEGGASVSPSVSITSKDKLTKNATIESITGNLGVTYDSQKGLSSFNVSASRNISTLKFQNLGGLFPYISSEKSSSGSLGSSLQLNDYLTFTPKNELSFENTNFTFSLALGTEIWGAEGQFQFTAWGSIQHLSSAEKNKLIPAFGYENTENAISGQSILDFNREKDRIVNENTKALAIPNYTYDSYAISGQGLMGSFRPYRSQVGNVYDTYTSSTGNGFSVGVELGLGGYVHGGIDVEVNPSSSSSGRWEDSKNVVLNALSLDDNNQNADYEATYYKMSGDLSADNEYNVSQNNYYDIRPIKIGIGGGKFNRKTQMNYKAKTYTNNSINYTNENVATIKRPEREDRSNAIRKVTNIEALNEGLITNRTESFVQDHHTAGISILKPDGSTYVYGETAYNTKKIEATFAVKGDDDADCSTGLVTYYPDSNTNLGDNSIGNSKGRDHFFNKITTPAYAHSYLLTSVLSKDYEDLKNDGPTFDDLGNYTKISYSPANNYNWRVPFMSNSASYNAGLNTDKIDQKGNYIYGEKELKYVSEIRTKTHIAKFYLSDRNDAKGVIGEDGGLGSSKMRQIDKIVLYALPDFELNGESDAVPIKTVHFKYNYTLCDDVPNSSSGKLTLEKIYFTYQNSNIGEYTPYIFNYSENNPSYNLKGYDVWGFYKENLNTGCDVLEGNLTPSEFPFVEQNKDLADLNTTSWTLESIDLPSGGKLTIEQESDDYQFVQDRRAMQMFKITGAGDTDSPNESQIDGNKLYNGSTPMRYLYVKLPDNLPEEYYTSDFLNDFIKSNAGANGDIGYSQNNLLYFRFLTNMTPDINSDSYDYVTGYLELDSIDGNTKFFKIATGNLAGKYVALPLRFQDKEGGVVGSNEEVNPISKAGWYFARKYLNRQSYGLEASSEINSIGDVVEPLLNSLSSIVTIFSGPNQALKAKDIASTFVPEKSWIRLYEPFGFKYGGGIRVKKITLDDQWDAMTGNPNNELYSSQYGQEYTYLDEDGKSSGVATFEPNGSKENPFVLPIFDSPVKVIAPKESNYIEKPLGESFFPVAQVTYGRVVVKNLNKDVLDAQGNPIVTLSKHATGEVITSFYTSKDFPTLADYTDPTVEFDKTGVLGNFLKVLTRNHLTMSQGIVVHTNDMNGKMKSQRVRAVGQEEGEYISGVDYNYAVDGNGKLDNKLDIIQQDGSVSKELIGVTYDMINDFRKSKSKSEVVGGDGNLAVIPALFGIPFPIPSLFPNLRRHETVLKMSSTTKLIHTNGILKEKIAYDLGSRVATKNLGWDAQTGEVLLTEVDNEYNDKYYNFTYPANWYYKNMGLASNNLGFKGIIDYQSENDYRIYDPISENLINNVKDYLNLGDEIFIEGESERYWVVSIIDQTIKLMLDTGVLLDDDISTTILYSPFTVIRSGKRNNLNSSMASVTTRDFPFVPDDEGLILIDSTQWVDYKVINASAVEFSDLWIGQNEGLLHYITNLNYDELWNISGDQKLNPYFFNNKGEFRAQKSYAYLTGRNNGSIGYHPRNEGFFENYSPFYKRGNTGTWEMDNTGWTNASEVTQISPVGYELENKDAIDRYSAAQYDQPTGLPKAVTSNAKYEEIGFDGFELFQSYSHFDLRSIVDFNTNATIENETAHTGKTSLKITNGAASRCFKFGHANNEGGPNLECLSNIDLELDKEYVFSAWVKEDVIEQLISYNNSLIKIGFYDTEDDLIESFPFIPTGYIIDGWQQITGVFKVPLQDHQRFIIAFYNFGQESIYYDDIRIHPFNSNLKSFVYDPESLRLMAELDENNYATFYEYDKEGGLIRVKKETEKGVYTIQETRSKTAIKQ
ncbi:MAG: hypothetical protein QM499_05125 [Flavobacteriaceae bacterium]